VLSYYKSDEDIYNEMFLGYTATAIGKGSLLYNACMPVCMQLSQALLSLDETTKKVFAKSALESGYSAYLDSRVGEMGITRKVANYALIEITVAGTPQKIVLQNSIFGTADNRLYTTQSDLILDYNGIGKVIVRAEKTGSKYNVNANEINNLPIKYSGIKSVTNEKAYYDAYDKETDQALYDRYLAKVQTPSTSGNKYHYMNWALEVNGVGSAKVYPLWNGNGTVKIVITNSNKRAASQDLIQAVIDHIEEERPIGSTVTVVSVTEKAINVAANAQISSATTLGTVQNSFITALESYFKDTFNSTKVSIMKIGSMLLDIDGALDVDYQSIKLNNVADNVTLGNDEIAVLGIVNLGVM